MHERHRRVRGPRSAVAGDIAGDDPHQCAPVSRGQQGDVIGFESLVGRLDHLVPRGQVHPQLNAMEQPPGHDERLGWRLNVENALAGRHPLRGAVPDDTTATVRVLVLKGAVDHVGDRLESPVGVPRRALRLPRRVLDLPHLVHVDERIEVRQIDAGESAAHGEALPLQATRRTRHGAHRTLHDLRPVWRRNGGERGQVSDGHSGHRNLRSLLANRRRGSRSPVCRIREAQWRWRSQSDGTRPAGPGVG